MLFEMHFEFSCFVFLSNTNIFMNIYEDTQQHTSTVGVSKLCEGEHFLYIFNVVGNKRTEIWDYVSSHIYFKSLFCNNVINFYRQWMVWHNSRSLLLSLSQDQDTYRFIHIKHKQKLTKTFELCKCLFFLFEIASRYKTVKLSLWTYEFPL